MPAATVTPTRPQTGANPIENGAGRAGKADMAERVTGKSLSAQHQEIAHQPRHDGRHACGDKCIPHEIVFKHGGDDRDDVVVVTMVMQMVGALDVASARQHEDMAVGAHDLDLGAVELRQHRGRNHLIDGAERGVTVAEIEHAIERADQLIELVGAEQDRDVTLAGEATNQIDDCLLIAIVEADQRLVEQ